MKKSLLVLLFFAVVASAVSAQSFEVIDYTTLEKTIQDKKSKQYYPRLLKTYQEKPSALSLDDFRHLYYGFIFQENYRPYDRNSLDTEITSKMGSASTTQEFEELVGICEAYLKKDPFSLKILYYLQEFRKNLESNKNSNNKKLATQFNGIIKAILSTGDGKTIQTGYTVNHPSDEYMILRSLDLGIADTKFEAAYDYFTVTENDQKIDGIYFDIAKMVQIGSKQIGVQTIEVENEEIPTDGVEIGSKDELQEFIPAGHKLFFELKADFNQDKKQDWLIITANETEQSISDFGNNQPAYRKLILLTRNEDNVLEKQFENQKAILCVDCGSPNKDAFVSFIYNDKKELVLTMQGGDLYRWERKSTFAYKKKEWLLIQDEFTSYRKGKKDKKNTEIETKKDFGKVLLSEFDSYKLFD